MTYLGRLAALDRKATKSEPLGICRHFVVGDLHGVARLETVKGVRDGVVCAAHESSTNESERLSKRCIAGTFHCPVENSLLGHDRDDGGTHPAPVLHVCDVKQGYVGSTAYYTTQKRSYLPYSAPRPGTWSPARKLAWRGRLAWQQGASRDS